MEQKEGLEQKDLLRLTVGRDKIHHGCVHDGKSFRLYLGGLGSRKKWMLGLN